VEEARRKWRKREREKQREREREKGEGDRTVRTVHRTRQRKIFNLFNGSKVLHMIARAFIEIPVKLRQNTHLKMFCFYLLKMQICLCQKKLMHCLHCPLECRETKGSVSVYVWAAVFLVSILGFAVLVHKGLITKENLLQQVQKQHFFI
jgi:hypothetical protein